MKSPHKTHKNGMVKISVPSMMELSDHILLQFEHLCAHKSSLKNMLLIYPKTLVQKGHSK